MEYNWMPLIITVNFENSLISAVKHEFQSSPILASNFWRIEKNNSTFISDQVNSRLFRAFNINSN
ncbi:hypothetical protein HZS_1636 [Henneguya salminicola]|nr:hypothetical protein HZS_1636 [Henneguya salminicola]